MAQQVYVPTVPKFGERDVMGSWEIQKPLVDAGYTPGLMVFTQGGRKSVVDRATVDLQYKNLGCVAKEYGQNPVVVMLSNIPLEEIDFFGNQEVAEEHVKRGIDFAKGLPIGGKKTLTYHLNSLVPQERFNRSDMGEWNYIFDTLVAPGLRRVAQYARDSGVDVLVETVPLPEFGDESPEKTKPSQFPGVMRRDLRNPFYHFSGNHIWRGLERAGLGVCVDLCHSRTIYDGHADRGVFATDSQQFPVNAGRMVGVVDTPESTVSFNLRNDVSDPNTRLIHLNDGSGLWTPEGGVFVEGVALGQGEIKCLDEILGIMERRGLPFVLEINETDFKERPNTKASIKYLVDRQEALT